MENQNELFEQTDDLAHMRTQYLFIERNINLYRELKK